MSAEYRKVKDLFNQAVELEPAARSEFLEAECDDPAIRAAVEEMLAADAADEDALDRGAFAVFGGDSVALPEKIGEYRVVREIGRGGMGVVYEAVRESRETRRRVAIKVIKRGMDTDAIISRFRHEQRILASLEHPFVARFLDDGTNSEGLPYYVMEFVEGAPIGEFVKNSELGVRDILTLFRDVCAAIEYAHQNLVVHRDLKPGNILVTPDGKPKILDFGIGKILSPDGDDQDAGTATQFGMMTPAYASPEQIRGERIGTASDIYSLGVVLYELLAGVKPFEIGSVSQIGAQLRILESEPPRPSAAADKDAVRAKALRGDLDNILLKSLAKEPAERYASAGQFAEDLRRYTEGVPVLARPHTFSYRFSKFVRRNRVAVVAAILVFASMIGGVAVSLWQARRAEQQRILAEKRFAEVRTIANNVVFKYHDEIEKLEGSTAVREMLIRDATAYLDNLAADSRGDAALERELALAYLKLGDVQGKMYAANTGNTAGAQASYEKAVGLLEKVVAARPADVGVKDDFIKANDSLVFLLGRSDSKNADKIAMLDRSARMIDEILQIEPKNAKRLAQLATLYIRYGDSVGHVGIRESLEQKLAYHQKALAFAEELSGLDPDGLEARKTVLRINQRMGSDYVWLGENSARNGDFDDAQANYQRALPFHEKMFQIAEKLASDPAADASVRRNFLAAHLSYGETLNRNGRHADALNLARNALALAHAAQNADQGNREAKFDVAEAYRLTAVIFGSKREFAQAIDNISRAIAICEEMFAADGNNFEARNQTVQNLNSLKRFQEESGDSVRAAETSKRLAEFKTTSKLTAN